MKFHRLTIILCLILFFHSGLSAVQPKLPPNYPQAQYDEDKVPAYTLPELLVTQEGQKVTDANTWLQKRRPEIIKMFAENVYGKTVVGKPAEMTWKVTSENRNDINGTAITKTITFYFNGKANGPKMDVNFTLPKSAEKKPVPLVCIVEWAPKVEWLLPRGYGLATFESAQIEPDIKSGSYEKSIRKFYNKPDTNGVAADEWGAIGAWAWGLSRIMDYAQTDKDIDSNKVIVAGFSRYGKTAMWAGAQDTRFAIIFSGESGCGGIVIARRQFGETIKIIQEKFPHWFCKNLKKYGDNINDLPVDWHMLVACMAPRPIYIATAQDDLWGDPKGSFLSGKFAQPVYDLFGEKGLGVEEMPPLETPVGDFIGFHMRPGGHGLTEYDWTQFLNFADKHFNKMKTQ